MIFMKYIFFAVFTMISCSIFAQDYIVKKDGEKIEAKVMEVTSTMIKYRKSTQPEGPDRTIEISKVKEIVYSDGQFDTFDTPKTIEKESPQTPAQPATSTPEKQVEQVPEAQPTPEENLRSALKRDRILKSGLTVDGVFGYALANEITVEKKILEYNNAGYPIFGGQQKTSIPSSFYSLSIRLGNKWYFNQNDKWRTGLQVNWFRFGIYIDGENVGESLFLGPKMLTPLNIGWTNVFKFTDNIGLEVNITGGGNLNIDLDYGGIYTGYTVNPEVKFRWKKLAVGLDYFFYSEDLMNQSATDPYNAIVSRQRNWNNFGLSIGAKL